MRALIPAIEEFSASPGRCGYIEAPEESDFPCADPGQRDWRSASTEWKAGNYGDPTQSSQYRELEHALFWAWVFAGESPSGV